MHRAEAGLRPGGFGMLIVSRVADEIAYNEAATKCCSSNTWTERPFRSSGRGPGWTDRRTCRPPTRRPPGTGGRRIPLVGRHDLARLGIGFVVRRHELHAVFVEGVEDVGVERVERREALLRGDSRQISSVYCT